MILWDLNVWYKEDVVNDEVVVEDTITINPAIYIANDDDDVYGSVRKVYTGILYKTTSEETAKIRAFRSEQEYGSDWFDFADELYELDISKGIQGFIDSLGDPTTIPIHDVDDLYHIDSIDKLSGLRTLPTNGQSS
jgi:hypothetical protein